MFSAMEPTNGISCFFSFFCVIICIIYLKQSTDGGFLRALAIGNKNGFEYLLHLVDDYSRDRVKRSIIGTDDGKIDTNWTEMKWCDRKNHRHFRKVDNSIKIIVPSNKKDPQTGKRKNAALTYSEFAKMAVVSFG